MRRPFAAALLMAFGLLTGPAVAAGAAEEGPEGAAERAKAAAVRVKAMEVARKAFVKVIFTPRWDPECALELQVANSAMMYETFWSDAGSSELDTRLSHFMELHRNKQTVTVPGLLLGKGLVAVADDGTGYEWKLVEKVEAEDASGRKWKATPHALLLEASALLFKLEGEAVPEAPEYRKDFKLSLTDRAFGASLVNEYDDPDAWYVACGGAYLPFDKEPATADRLVYPGGSATARGQAMAWTGGGTDMFFDAEGRPAGVNIGEVNLTNANRTAWAPAEILEKGLVTYEKLRAAEAAARELAGKVHYKVRFEFRVPKGDDEEDEMGMWMYRRQYYMDEGGAQDAETYGLAVAGRLLVPRTLSSAALQKVEKISVQVDEDWKPARFLATLRDFDGMVLEVPGVKLNELPDPYAGKGVEIMKPFVFCKVREHLGKKQAFAKGIRCLGREKGYRDQVRPLAREVPMGSLLFDLSGKLAGICVCERRERELVGISEEAGYGYGYYGYGMDLLDLAPFSKLKTALEEPAKNAIPTWRPMGKEEAKRLVWLGVEFDPITKDLAKRLKVNEPTCGGLVGYMVSSVYPGSPAEQLGIQAQDILLRLRVKGMGDPVPLVSAAAGEADAMFGGMGMGMPGMGGMGMRTWKPRANVLTLLLTEAGPGHDAEVTYWSNAEKKTKTGGFKLAYAPEDYDSAEKHKDEKLGLSVKPLTYEVRRALALAPDAPGVIICNIEQGSAAQLARLTPYMVIGQVEGTPVSSVGEFEKKIKELREAKKEKVKLQVTIMGKSRFADLQLQD